MDSDGVVDAPLEIRLAVTKAGEGLEFDFSGSSPPCAGPMNSVLATTLSSVYLAMRHVFPDVPISAGAFEPLAVTGIDGTFLDARYPRPVSGCAAEVSQRIAEAVHQGNQRLSRVEQVKRVYLLDREFSIDEDEITPTLKVKRKNVEKKFAATFDKLYDDPEFGIVVMDK